MQFERLYHELSAHVPTTFLVVPRDGPRGRFLPVKEPADLRGVRARSCGRCSRRLPGAGTGHGATARRRRFGTKPAPSRHGSSLASRDAAPRPRAPAPLRGLRPGRDVGLRRLPGAARALRAAVLRALRRTRALAGASLRRVQRPAARVRVGPRRRSSTTAARGRSSRRGRSAAGATLRPSPPSSSSPALPAAGGRRRSRSSRATAIAQLTRGHAPAAALAAELASGLVDPARDAAAAPARGSSASATCRAPNVAATWRARFSPQGPAPPRVCLVDDVYTTGLDGDRVRDGAPPGRRPPGRSRVSGAGGAVVEWKVRDIRRRGMEDRHATQAHRPSRQPERRHARRTRRRSCRSSIGVCTI